jgi:hypothetical protein
MLTALAIGLLAIGTGVGWVGASLCRAAALSDQLDEQLRVLDATRVVMRAASSRDQRPGG